MEHGYIALNTTSEVSIIFIIKKLFSKLLSMSCAGWDPRFSDNINNTHILLKWNKEIE